MRKDRDRPRAPPGTQVRALGKDGPQCIDIGGARWSETAEAVFLDTLATTCNITAAAAAAGFTPGTVYYRRRRDPGFADRWRAALDQGYVRIEALLLESATRSLSGWAPPPDCAIPPMTVKEAMGMLALHRAMVKGGTHQRYDWRRRPPALDDVKASILDKLARIERAQARGEAPPDPAPLA